ncbi:hypothetical protein BY996DRAFT_7107119 [Phakopsora pachyrhizi]|nr:hypothetical protein BY996DRAFT_7107119 [Phakopsora pachyrhizi]
MSFSYKRLSDPTYEWSGNGLRALFKGITSLRDLLSQIRMIWDIIRFNCLAIDVLDQDDEDLDVTIDKYLVDHNYSDGFRNHYLLPMVACIWSTPIDKTALLFPMKTLVRFMLNHHLLQIFHQPQWLTIRNGSRSYVDRILSKLRPESCFKGTKIQSISIDDNGKISLFDRLGRSFEGYDHIIFGSHADQTRQILQSSNSDGKFDQQIDLLSDFQFSKNVAVLHNDISLMPLNREIWASWNYFTGQRKSKPKSFSDCDHNSIAMESTVSLTYWMNLLQSIPEEKYGPILVTLNPAEPIDQRFISGQWEYEHALYTSKSVKAQSRLSEIQGLSGLSYVGAWTKYGFHEDGFTSALKLLVRDKYELFRVKSPIGLTIRDEKVRPPGLIVRLIIFCIQALFEIFFLILKVLGSSLGKTKKS